MLGLQKGLVFLRPRIGVATALRLMSWRAGGNTTLRRAAAVTLTTAEPSTHPYIVHRLPQHACNNCQCSNGSALDPSVILYKRSCHWPW